MSNFSDRARELLTLIADSEDGIPMSSLVPTEHGEPEDGQPSYSEELTGLLQGRLVRLVSDPDGGKIQLTPLGAKAVPELPQRPEGYDADGEETDGEEEADGEEADAPDADGEEDDLGNEPDE